MYERLTIRDRFARQGNGEIAHKKCYELCRPPMSCEVCELELEMLDRLAAYEDSGLTPEEVTKVIKSGVPEWIDKYLEYRKLEAEGRLVVLPCKVGDTVYKLTSDALSGIEETKINRIVIKKNKITFNADCINDDWGRAAWDIRVCDFGKTVFLTREAAENALGGAEG